MADFELDFSDVIDNTARIETTAMDATERAMEDMVEDLIRISSQIAPILSGFLRSNYDSEIRRTPTNVVGEVAYSAVNNSRKRDSSGRFTSGGYGRFNYALWTHEADYQLGEQSRAAAGTDGYEVGNKYLERPLYGEANKWLDWVSQEVRKSIKG